MKKSLLIFVLSCLLTLLCSTVALAYNPGQRTFALLGNTLNSDKHPVHLVVTQTIDMKEVLTPEAYEKLTNAQKKRVNRIEYNEANGINAERIVTTDGDGVVVKDCVTYVKGGHWYTIDYLNKNYDSIPELPGMSLPFAETLVSWFTTRPTAGNDSITGYDYDEVTKNGNTLRFYFAKDTDTWKGYEVSYLPLFEVVEYSETVDVEKAFALPPQGFPKVANMTMRNYAAKLFQKK